jgi:hypothetical protein
MFGVELGGLGVGCPARQGRESSRQDKHFHVLPLIQLFAVHNTDHLSRKRLACHSCSTVLRTDDETVTMR